ncbi:N-acetylmuramoyl-L-alanine amidase [Cerasibacillus sp. JNUCC 74]
MKKIYLIITSLIIMLTSLFLIPKQSLAAEGEVYQVGQAILNVRDEPSIHAEIIGKLHTGDQLVEFQEKYGWIQTYYGGKEAWVAKQHLIPLQQDKQTNIKPTAHKPVTAPQKKREVSTRGNASLKGYNIMLDPGHGGHDPGSIGIGGLQEKAITLATTRQIAEQLRNAGASVLLTRSGDEYVSLRDRVEISRAYYTHAFISIHYNAFFNSGAHGLNTFYYSSADQKLAANVHASLASSIYLQDRGMKQGNYYVLRNNYAPSILLELGFITNYSDLANIQTNQFQIQVAEAVTNGLRNYFSH